MLLNLCTIVVIVLLNVLLSECFVSEIMMCLLYWIVTCFEPVQLGKVLYKSYVYMTIISSDGAVVRRTSICLFIQSLKGTRP